MSLDVLLEAQGLVALFCVNQHLSGGAFGLWAWMALGKNPRVAFPISICWHAVRHSEAAASRGLPLLPQGSQRGVHVLKDLQVASCVSP